MVKDAKISYKVALNFKLFDFEATLHSIYAIMRIETVQTPRHINDWMNLPWSIYQNDKNWIPHLKQDIEKVFDPASNKLYKSGKLIRFSLYENNQIIGRIAAFHFPKLSAKQKLKVGGIGFFECIENQSAAFKLFDAAVDWLKSEGMEAVDGPINFGERDAFWGLLTENFTDMSSYRMNYNPPYYKSFFENYGFQTYFEQWCFKRPIALPTSDIFEKKQFALTQDTRFRVSHVRGRSVEEIANDFLVVYNNAWAGISGFKEMEYKQALNTVKAMKPIMDPDIVYFAYYDNLPIGFYVNIPELNEIFQHINGNLNWWGKIKFLYYKFFGKREIMVGLVFGVDRAYHGKGVESAMIKYAEKHLATLNRYTDTILTWIGDFNPKMLKVVDNLQASKYRTLITYRKHFDKSIPFERCPEIK